MLTPLSTDELKKAATHHHLLVGKYEELFELTLQMNDYIRAINIRTEKLNKIRANMMKIQDEISRLEEETNHAR